jgi:chromosome segregation ATPase
LLEKINSQKQEISEREKRIDALKNELHVVREDRNHYKNELSQNWTTVALAKYYCKRANAAEDFITDVIKL